MNNRLTNHCCDEMTFFLKEKKVAIEYNKVFKEYYIRLWTSGGLQTIYYCPWCGTKLPGSLYEKCISELEKLGLCLSDESLPEKYKSDQWWREKNL